MALASDQINKISPNRPASIYRSILSIVILCILSVFMYSSKLEYKISFFKYFVVYIYSVFRKFLPKCDCAYLY